MATETDRKTIGQTAQATSRAKRERSVWRILAIASVLAQLTASPATAEDHKVGGISESTVHLTTWAPKGFNLSGPNANGERRWKFYLRRVQVYVCDESCDQPPDSYPEKQRPTYKWQKLEDLPSFDMVRLTFTTEAGVAVGQTLTIVNRPLFWFLFKRLRLQGIEQFDLAPAACTPPPRPQHPTEWVKRVELRQKGVSGSLRIEKVEVIGPKGAQAKVHTKAQLGATKHFLIWFSDHHD